MRFYRVRVTLSDGTVIKAGGFARLDSAEAEAQSWTSLEVAESRHANGAPQVIAAIVVKPAGPDVIVSRFAVPHGRIPEMTA